MELESSGGTVQLVRTSAPTGGGLLELEEALLLQARIARHSCSFQYSAQVLNCRPLYIILKSCGALLTTRHGTAHQKSAVFIGGRCTCS